MAGMRQIDLETSQYNPSGSEKELADDILRLTASTAELKKTAGYCEFIYRKFQQKTLRTLLG